MKKFTNNLSNRSSIFKASDFHRPGVSIDQISELKQAFDLFDNNQIGFINCKELKSAMLLHTLDSYSPTLFNLVSDLANNNNTIDFAAFLDLMSANVGIKISKKNIKKTFGLFDDQKTGFVSIKNLRKLAKQLNLNLSESQLQLLLQKADQDNDGLVSEQEFYEIMSK